MNLYEIDAAIMDCIDEDTGEIIDQAALDELNLSRDEKVENIALAIKNLKSEAEAIKAEKQNLAARQAAAERKTESLKNYLSDYLQGDKFKSAKVSISWRKSEVVLVDDISKLPDDFLRFKDPEVDKTKLKEAMKAGQSFEGARLVQNNNIQIK
jgi:seryl-tRNA synthetase